MKKAFPRRAIEKMMEIAGHDVSYDDIIEMSKKDVPWFHNYTWAKDQEETWKTWFIENVRKEYKFTKKIAEREFNWFNLAFGLRRNDT